MSINDCSGEILCSLITEVEDKSKFSPQIELGEIYRIKRSIKYSEYYKRKYNNTYSIVYFKEK